MSRSIAFSMCRVAVSCSSPTVMDDAVADRQSRTEDDDSRKPCPDDVNAVFLCWAASID